MADGTPTTTNKQFNASDSDITIQSADGVLFNIHRKNLEVSTGAFPGSEFNTEGEHVYLTEPAAVLEILFQFLYPKRHPDLKNLTFHILLQVAEAVEKYEVYSAMTVCDLRLRNFISAHAVEIFSHAAKHDYPDLMNASSPRIARSPLVPMLEKLPAHTLVPIVKYRAAWDAIFDRAIRHLQHLEYGGTCESRYRSGACNNCLLCLIAWVTFLKEIDDISGLQMAMRAPTLKRSTTQRLCHHCTFNKCPELPQLIRVIEDGIRAIPPFSHFLDLKTSGATSKT